MHTSTRNFLHMSSIAAAIFLWAMTATRLSAEGRSWIADSDADAAWLIYGTPESDDILFSLTCEKAAKTLTVWFATEPAARKTPETLPMELVSAGGSVRLTGNGARSEMDDAFSLEARTVLTPEMEKLLSSGGKTISVKVEGAARDLPVDETAQKGIEVIVKDCRK